MPIKEVTSMANREVCDLVFCNYGTHTPFLNLDYANVTTTGVTGETVFAYGGKGHPKRVSFTGERGGTITIETQMTSAKLFSMMTGSNIETSAKFLKREEIVAASAGTLTLSEAAVSDTLTLFAANDDMGEAIEASVSGTEVTATGVASGEKYVAYYIVEASSGILKLSIKSTTFPRAFTVYGDTFYKTEGDEIVPYRLVGYKCVPQSTFDLSFSNTGDPGSITITCDLMADSDDNILDLILQENA